MCLCEDVETMNTLKDNNSPKLLCGMKENSRRLNVAAAQHTKATKQQTTGNNLHCSCRTHKHTMQFEGRRRKIKHKNNLRKR